ncbi:MAG TPA: GGDEF domain-containing protein [Patescibacteria group bacterium]|nr:GGDEF domain-containing protein [Patescibacteria group bacterium]
MDQSFGPEQESIEAEQFGIELPEVILHSSEELKSYPQTDLVDYTRDLERRLVAQQAINASLASLEVKREKEMAQREEEIAETEKIDDVTGLLARSAWEERLKSMIESGEHDFGVIFLDLSRFKNVNDTLGHPFGDEILRRTASSLRHEEDQVSRYGGDEFAILCDLVAREGSALSLTERLQSVINRLRVKFEDMVQSEKLDKLGFDIAIGGAVFEPGDTPEWLVKKADKSMYADKYARRAELTEEDIVDLRKARPAIEKLGYRLPDEIL